MSLSAFELSLKENARILSSPFVFQMFGMLPGGEEGGLDTDQQEDATEEDPEDDHDNGNVEKDAAPSEESKPNTGAAARQGDDVKAGSIGIRLEDELFQLSRGFRSPTGPIFTEEYWRQFSEDLTVSTGSGEANGSSVGAGIGKTARRRRAKEISTWLREEGYFVDEPDSGEIERVKLGHMVKAIRALKQAGWPSVFAFVFDEIWEMFRRIWPLMNDVLGGECVLEPSFFVYSLENFKGQKVCFGPVCFP